MTTDHPPMSTEATVDMLRDRARRLKESTAAGGDTDVACGVTWLFDDPPIAITLIGAPHPSAALHYGAPITAGSSGVALIADSYTATTDDGDGLGADPTRSGPLSAHATLADAFAAGDDQVSEAMVVVVAPRDGDATVLSIKYLRTGTTVTWGDEMREMLADAGGDYGRLLAMMRAPMVAEMPPGLPSFRPTTAPGDDAHHQNMIFAHVPQTIADLMARDSDRDEIALSVLVESRNDLDAGAARWIEAYGPVIGGETGGD